MTTVITLVFTVEGDRTEKEAERYITRAFDRLWDEGMFDTTYEVVDTDTIDE